MKTATREFNPFIPVKDITDEPDMFTEALMEDALTAAESDPFGDGPLRAKTPKAEPKPYDRGQAGEVKKVGPGEYLVESFKTPGDFYTVNLKKNTCDCPHSVKRQATTCKHRDQAREEARRLVLSRALFLPVEELKKQAARKDLRPEIAEAVRIALGCRSHGEYARI